MLFGMHSASGAGGGCVIREWNDAYAVSKVVSAPLHL